MILLFHRIIIRKIIFIHMEFICHHFHFIMHIKENNRKHLNEIKWVKSMKLFKYLILDFLFFVEWDHCQFHEDCGEGNCCYAHFRFRSLPKSFCRVNRNNKSELCEPLTKYRSLKDVPAWKQQKQQFNEEEQFISLRAII